MKLSCIKEKLACKEVLLVEIMRNPANVAQWVTWIRDASGKSFLLMDEDESVVTTEDANRIFALLNSAGVKRVSVQF